MDLISQNLRQVKVYPNPWRSDRHAGENITFDGLTAGTDVKIFTIAGRKVKALRSDGPRTVWDRTDNAGDNAASGVYLYLVTNSQGDKATGKLAIIK